MKFQLHSICRNFNAETGARGAMPPPPLPPSTPNLNLRTKQGSKISVSDIRDIAFYGCTYQVFHNFYRVCYNFWTIYGGFSFF